MNDEALFQATVPMFTHYMQRIDAIALSLSDDKTRNLTSQLTPATFSAGEHFKISQGFALRTVFPLMGLEIPELTSEQTDVRGLKLRSTEIQSLLAPLTVSNFKGASDRLISHTAGTAELVQNATEFVTLYAVPNFFFHLTMGYATLRHCGIDLGKADFDGFHAYPSGFRFS